LAATASGIRRASMPGASGASPPWCAEVGSVVPWAQHPRRQLRGIVGVLERSLSD
jgi:hypothetical protein